MDSAAVMRAGAQPASLIVNADDYGSYDWVSRGILQSARHGIVTATGILATGKRFDDHIAWLKDHTDLDLGLHLNLTDREPLTQAMRNRLARWQGRFPPKFTVAMAVLSGVLPVADVRLEWRAQIERCLDKGLTVRFINSHEHIHMLPPLFGVTGELAQEYGIPHVRLPTSDGFRNWKPGAFIRDTLMKGLAAINQSRLDHPAPVFLGMAESGRLSLAALQNLIPRLQPGGVYELMCHPGFRIDAEIDNPQLFGYHDWEGELAALTSVEARALLDRHGIRLIRYRDLEHRDETGGAKPRQLKQQEQLKQQQLQQHKLQQQQMKLQEQMKQQQLKQQQMQQQKAQQQQQLQQQQRKKKELPEPTQQQQLLTCGRLRRHNFLHLQAAAPLPGGSLQFVVASCPSPG